MKKIFLALLFLIGCSKIDELDTDHYMIVQYNQLGIPFMCYQIITRSFYEGDQYVRWTEKYGNSDNSFVITGNYSRMRVTDGDWHYAAKMLGVDVNKCTNGKYPGDLE